MSALIGPWWRENVSPESNHASKVAGKSVCLRHFAPCPYERITCLKTLHWTPPYQTLGVGLPHDTWAIPFQGHLRNSVVCAACQVQVALRQRYRCWADRYTARIVYCSFHMLIWGEKASTWPHLGLFSSPVLFVKDTVYLVRNNGFLFH